uniref:Uncharacterized protein n=1 Tax=Anguilla anguilla TaxID=7936 RepID=A0A0E9PWM3_ANGAN
MSQCARVPTEAAIPRLALYCE